MPKKSDTLYILDGHAILHRAWHALPPLQTKDGKLVNAVYGFLLILLKLLREQKPTHLAVTFDRAEPTFRHEAYTEYKAQREKQADELYAQIPILQQVLQAFHIPIYEQAGYEADDVLGTIAAKTSKAGVATMIVTGDLDTLQLVDKNVSVYTFARGIKDAVVYDEAGVLARYGLEPKQLIDWKALRGDLSDNIKGVRGIGEKTATDLIQQFGSLDDLYAALKKRTPKTQKLREKVVELLTAGEEDARRSLDLVTIRRNVPIGFRLEDSRVQEPDRATLVPLLQELGFRSLADKLTGSEVEDKKSEIRNPPPKADPPRVEKSEKKPEYQLVKTKAEAQAVAAALMGAKCCAFRAHPRPDDRFDNNLLGVAVSWTAGEAAFIPHEHLGVLAVAFENPNLTKIGHDLKHDLHLLASANIAPPTAPLHDIMVSSYLLNSASRAHGLKDLAFEHFGRQLPKLAAQGTLLPPRLEDTYRTVCEETDLILQLSEKLDAELVAREQTKLLQEIEMPLVPVLASMERHGVKIDVPYLDEMAKSLHARLAELSKEIYQLAGEEFNINSPSQLKVILFDKLKIPAKVKRTATGALSTAAGELEKVRGSHPIIDLIFEHREIQKLVSTYVDTLPTLVRKDTLRVHTSFNQTVAATGRLSSSEPNLQNIPIRSELGAKIRRAFIAERGHVLVAADYSQIELRLIAQIAKVRRMLQAFRNGEDTHAATAAEIWNVPLEKVTKEQRYSAKTINFGLLYGMGQNSLAAGTGMSGPEAREFIQRYFDVYPEIRDYMDQTKALAATQGYVETLFGRRRYLPEIRSGVGAVRAAAERMAINAPVQGSAADLIKLAMVAVYDWIAAEFGFAKDADVKMVLQVHDELVFEVKKGLESKVAKKVKDLMEHVREFEVPIIAEVEYGSSWGQLEKI